MNAIHIHLVLNHFPVVFAIAALVLFVAAKVLKVDQYRKAGLFLCIIGGLLAVPTYFSGDEAEEMLENRPGVMQERINQHEEAGERAMITSLVLAAVAAAAVWRERKGNPPAWVYWAPILIALITIGSLGYAGFIGGKIRHTEIHGEP